MVSIRQFFGLSGKSPHINATGRFDAKSLTEVWPSENLLQQKNNREAALALNNLDRGLENERLKSIITARYEWEGEATKELIQGYIESVIYSCGFAIGWEWKGLPMFSAATIVEWDRNYQPEKFSVICNKSFSGMIIGRDDAVIIKESNSMNVINEAQFPASEPYALRRAAVIADSGRAGEVYINGLKKPYIMATDDEDSLTNQSLINQLLNNFPFIMATFRKRLAGQETTPIFHNSPHNGADLQAILNAKLALRSEALQLMGLAGGGSKEKNQYVSGDERDSDSQIGSILEGAAFSNRQKACDEMKEKFGWDISVKRTELQGQKEEEAIEEEKEGEEKNADTSAVSD